MLTQQRCQLLEHRGVVDQLLQCPLILVHASELPPARKDLRGERLRRRYLVPADQRQITVDALRCGKAGSRFLR